MPRDDKKITLDDILAEYERQDDVSGSRGNVSAAGLTADNKYDDGNSEDMEISEEISIDGDEDFDDVEIVNEPFAAPDSHTWSEVGAEDLPILSGTFDGMAVNDADGSDVSEFIAGVVENAVNDMAEQSQNGGRSGGLSRIEQINADRRAKQNGGTDSKTKTVGTDDKAKPIGADVKAKAVNTGSKPKDVGADVKAKAVNTGSKPKDVGADVKAKAVSTDDKVKAVSADSKVKKDSTEVKIKDVSAESKKKTIGADSKSKAVSADDKSKAVSKDNKPEQSIGIAGGVDNTDVDGKSESDSIIQALEASDDVNDRWLAKFVKAIFPVKGDGIGEVIRKIVFLSAVIVFIGAGVMLISTLKQSKEAIDIQETVQSIIVTTVATTVDEEGNVHTIPPTSEEISQHISEVAEVISEFNEDYVGYLEIPGCNIYEPVVQGDDNEKYLRTNIYGNYNKAGTVFMDYRCSLTDGYTSPNIVIYGHNQEDGTMFGRLKLYKYDLAFYQRNPYVRFSTDTETSQYLVYGFFVTNANEKQDSDGIVFHYHDYIDEINDETTFDWYIGEIQSRNQIVSPVDVRYGDELLCLSTCSSDFTDSRFVVFARKLRQGESIYDYDFQKARLNPNAKGVDWEAVLSGEFPEEEDNFDDELSEVVTSEKSLNKRNVRTETAGSETEAPLEEAPGTAVTTVPPKTEQSSQTVIPSESSTDAETVSGSGETSDVSENDSDTGNDSGSDSGSDGENSSESVDSSSTVETTARKKTNKTNNTSPAE